MGNKNPKYCIPSSDGLASCYSTSPINLHQKDNIQESNYFTFNTGSRVITFTEFVSEGTNVPLVSYTITNGGNTAADGVVGTLTSLNSTAFPFTIQYFVNKTLVPKNSPVTVSMGDIVDVYVTGPIPQYMTITLPDPYWTSNSAVTYCNVNQYLLKLADKSTPGAQIANSC